MIFGCFTVSMASTMLTLAWRSLVLLCVVSQVTGEPLKASLKPKYIHHNYKQMTNFLKKAASRYPHLTELISIGDTVQGKIHTPPRCTRLDQSLPLTTLEYLCIIQRVFQFKVIINGLLSSFCFI